MGGPLKAVFFDAGHTLIESHPDVLGIYRKAAEAFGIAIPAHRSEHLLSALYAAYDASTRRSMKTAVTDDADKAMWRAVTRQVYDAMPELQAADYDSWFEHIHDIFVDPATWRPYEETVEVLEMRHAELLDGGITKRAKHLEPIVENLRPRR